MSSESHSLGENELVYISGKQAEEVGFEKFSRRQARLRGIHVLVLDRMRINRSEDGDQQKVMELCSKVTDLDLSGNLFEHFGDVLYLCLCLPNLKSVTLDSNRFTVPLRGPAYAHPKRMHFLSLSGTLLPGNQLSRLLSTFPTVENLVLAENEMNGAEHPVYPTNLTSIDLSDNDFVSLSEVRGLQERCQNLLTIALRRNAITAVGQAPTLPQTITKIDVSYNAISTWSFVDALNTSFFPNLRHLSITGNALYNNLKSASGTLLAPEDSHMLTIARVPQLRSLNLSKIGEKERLNAETYYLSQIAAELSLVPEAEHSVVVSRHPRYKALCAEYGAPILDSTSRKGAVDPNSLAARLVYLRFSLSSGVLPQVQNRTWHQTLPSSLTTYALLSLVATRLGLMPMALRLILETGEKDPAEKKGELGVHEWDSGDEAGDSGSDGKDEWVIREIEMVGGTRALGTFVEGGKGSVRVELVEGVA